MKKLLTIMMALALVVVGAGVMKAEAATSDTITITVTLQNISVSVTTPAWAIGTVAASSVNTHANTATNDGNVDEDLDIAVSNSTNWAVGAAAGADVFKMDVSVDGGSTWTAMPSTTAVNLVDPLAASGTQDFTLQFTAPSASATTAEESITVTVSASAA